MDHGTDNHPIRKERPYIEGLMQERRNSIVNTLELRLSCINPLI